MLDQANSFIPEVILMVGVIGIAALSLVANELGRRSGLGLPGRIALAGGLGFGVVAFTLKAGLVFYLNSLSADDIALLQDWQKPAVAALEPPPQEPVNALATSTFWSWQALPISAPAPSDNPSSAAKSALGKRLFFDARLSADGSVSCASCHKLADGGDDNAAVSTGIKGQMGDRNAPTVLNAAFLSRLFWDGRANSLEAQALGPLLNPIEMGLPSAEVLETKLAAIADYREAFAAVFGGDRPVRIENIAKAIAAYERTLITPDTPYDRFVRGDDKALDSQQIRGMALFGKIGCRNCHVDPMFSSAGIVKPFGVYRPFPLHTGHPLLAKYGLMVDGKRSSFRVPSLRNVALTAPYFHNGSVKTLEEAVRVMAVAQLGKKVSDRSRDDIAVSTSKDGSGRQLTVLDHGALSEDEVSDIAAFLHSLTATTLPMRAYQP